MIQTTHGIKLFFLNVFDIREGELNRALLMQFNIFLIISTLLIVKPVVNGLFLAEYGVEQLPFAYLLVAGFAAVVSFVYARMLNRISLYKISISTLVISVFCLILFGILLNTDLFQSVILYLFYIWVAIFALLATSQFWVLANMVFTPREAKRLFGFVGAGAIAGGIFGGYITSLLAESLGSESLPFVCAGILSICIPITMRVWSKSVVEIVPKLERKQRITKASARPIQLIRQSRHLTYIACIVGVSVMVAKLVDFQFSGIASRLIPDADELTAFLGFWFSTFNVISLLIQLFLTRRLVGTFGVGTSLFFLPAMILIAAILLFIFPELLLAAIFLKMADGGLKQSINKASMELLIMPISKDVKNQTKTFIDVFVDSMATGIIGLVLIFVIKGLDLPMIAVTWIIIALIVLWLFFANKVRKEYLRTFQIKLSEVSKKGKGEKVPDVSHLSVIQGWRRVLQSGDEDQILFVLKKLLENPDERLFTSVKNLLEHPSDDIKTEALHVLYFLKSENLSSVVLPLIEHQQQRIKIAAFEYILSQDPADEIEIMLRYISDPDHRVSGAALVTFAKETRQNPQIQNQLNLEMLIGKKIAQIAETKDPELSRFLTITLLKAIGHGNLTSYYHVIKQSLNDDDKTIVNEAITAAGATFSTLFINDLLTCLSDQATKSSAIKSLVNYKDGLIPILRYKVSQPETPLNIIQQIPSVIKLMNRQIAVDFLLDLLDHENILVRRESLRGLNLIRQNAPHLDFRPRFIAQRILDEARIYQNILLVLKAQVHIEKRTENQADEELGEARSRLIERLHKKLDSNLEKIFRLLGLKYPPEDIFNIYKGLNSRDSELTDSAIEFLDNLIEPGMKKVLIPIIESSMLESITEDAVKDLNVKLPSEFECFQLLLQGRDTQIKHATLLLINKLNQPEYIPLLDQFINGRDDQIQRHIQNVKESLQARTSQT